jgi:hypothetical protein
MDVERLLVAGYFHLDDSLFMEVGLQVTTGRIQTIEGNWSPISGHLKPPTPTLVIFDVASC